MSLQGVWAGIVSLLGMLSPGLSLAADRPLHSQVLVFVPAYEASQLFDPTLSENKTDPPVLVWGSVNVLFSSRLYFGLRMPNPVIARPMLAVGPVDIYGKFVSAMTRPADDAPGFSPYTEGSDFFIFAYDWRQEIATVSAPALGRALETYARIHEEKTGIPAAETKFIIVTHSMGGLLARTLISEQPRWAPRLSGLYLVGSPNGGSVKAIKTVVYGPNSLKANATGFPGVLLHLLPTDVDQNVTKLVGVTRPTLYELLPSKDPAWEVAGADGTHRRMAASDVFEASSWEPYWPSAELEKRLFLDGWLKKRQAEGRKQIDEPAWEFCQDPAYGPLKKLLAETREWRARMGDMNHTRDLLTRPGEATRMRLILSTGLKTPSGVITEGSHDSSRGTYTYAQGADGDGTMEASRVLDGLPANAPEVKILHGVTHGRLMVDAQFITYFRNELSRQPVVAARK